ncbi:PaaI family thioesterase [Asticcacaulis sp. EMRT-3]|uniref:PaaI family thioesterase n=1 Tax=Asticcacaulis sp. EMRT-3 TaxID=3040349 RepID=UPI0024AFD081|nr:PaaI family thioesterase [Asticcacaulis sp. EMRT-3]MDI7774439.1 PaaI family thioesterase [Asticcacaulis sp. EMRT-3]
MSPSPFHEMFATIIDNTPYMKAIGAVYAGRDDHGVTMRLPYRADLIGDPETRVIASGVVTALLDNGCGMAVWDRIGEYKPIATLDLRIDYMRPALPDNDLLVTAKCYKLTRSVGFVRAFAYEVSPDDPVAAAQAAFIVTSPALKAKA